MSYIDFPLPVIEILNRLEEWSQGQSISFEREESGSGFVWSSNEWRNFEFRFYFKQASSRDKEIYTFGALGNPGDLINYDSQFHHNKGNFHKPYQIDINSRIIGELDKEFEAWCARVNAFESSSLFGKIEEGYYEREFFDSFEIIEEDSNSAPFDLDQQKLIEELVIKTIGLLQEQRSEDEVIHQLIEEGKSIQSNISKLKKSALIRRISRWYGKIRSLGPTLSLEVLKFLTVEGVKALIGL